ncbi:MAG: DNA-protecting protein DprA [Chloroflexi bacterium]|nr:DNA-protecting protein DprA [Chloroflexota bacterium]
MSKLHWLALSAIPGIGGVTARKLVERFGSAEAVLNAPDEELKRMPRITAEVVARLQMVSLDVLEAELAALAEEGLQVVTWDDADYPLNLRQVGDAPPVLFVRGDLLPEDPHAVAIVGTRQPTPRAMALAETLAQELARRGLTIVSGLALGIDTAAHRGALQAAGGRTLAVLGSGLRVIHPRENIPLAETITQRGALLSEFHPNTPARGPNLMARDRIVSGLSQAVIVVEASEKSGSLDTAAKAQRQGRLLFAVPGSPGTQALLAEGAEPLDLQAADLDSRRQRIRDHAAYGDETQQGLWNT